MPLPFYQAARQFSNAAQHVERVASLQDARSVIRLAGPTLIHFLQGLLTNNVLPLEASNAPPMYSCILNAQGRYLHDLFLHRTGDAEPTVLADVDAAGKDDLLRLLKRYRLRQKIDIDDATSSHGVWARWCDAEVSSGSSVQSGEAAAAWRADPRLPELGQRSVLPVGDVAGTDAAGQYPWEEYRRWRIRHGVAEGDVEIPSGEAVALEYNVDGLHGISFTKGCYVGQELMARTHFKGVVRKRLMPFRVDAGSLAAAAGADVYESADCSGRAVGRVRVVEGQQGLAMLRLAAALGAVKEGRALYAEGGGALRPWRPSWWPPHWGKEA